MEQRNLERLEFHKVVQRMAEFTRSPMGRELAMAARPQSGKTKVERLHDQTSEGRELLRLDPGADIGGWHDIRNEVWRASREIVLEAGELEKVGRTLAVIIRLKIFFQERSSRYLILGDIASGLGNFAALERRINKSILSGGQIANDASPELDSIRRRIILSQQQIKDRLDRLIRSPSQQKYLQDPIVTMREGRYVVPVKQEYRSLVPGIVHDQSASGATVFIEPMGVVEANNELRRLQAAEKQEMHRILSSLTSGVAQQAGELNDSLSCLGEIDYIMARARYSERLGAWAPKIGNDTSFVIRNGRHPLLPGKVVPVSVHLGVGFDTLVITGPNTGGKTVTLKTAGLLVLMALAGMHIPADQGTVIGVFTQVYADIGDEQSIEQSLSTFSSHMSNIVNILKGARSGCLVLLDELGAGTDPAEGAALAQSILEYLHNLGARTIATTHYSELKNFAYARDRVDNASVEFDPVTLRPTYRLLLGKPGRSNAFEIALRLGISEEIISRARDFMTEEQIEFSEMMHNLEVAKYEAESERAEAEKLRKEATIIKERYQRKEQEFEIRRQDILEKARAKAGEMVRRARLETDEINRQLRAKLKENAAGNREAAIQKARSELRKMYGRYSSQDRKSFVSHQGQALADKDIEPGMEVFVPRFNQKGTVVEMTGNNGEIQVQVGVIKVNLPISELTMAEAKKEGERVCRGTIGLLKDKAKDISTKLDLRGMRVEEALDRTDKYLDDAGLAGLERVYIVHGKGTGALRSAVQEHLQVHHGVESYRLGKQGEGDAGVTVVNIKK